MSQIVTLVTSLYIPFLISDSEFIRVSMMRSSKTKARLGEHHVGQLAESPALAELLQPGGGGPGVYPVHQ